MTALPLILRSGFAVLVCTTAAQAHPGHLTGLAGHDHWVAGAAIGLAIALGLYGALKGKSTGADSDNAESDDGDAEPETKEVSA